MRICVNLLLVTCAAAALTACQSAPVAYQKPVLEAPKAWNADASAAPSTPRADRPDWWLDLKDPVLAGLIDAARSQNLDVKVAMARVDEARALSRINDAHYKPTISVEGSAVAGAGQRAFGGLNDFDTRLGGGVRADWEPDLYGLQKLESELGQAGLQAAGQQYRGAMNALVAEVSKAYIDLRQQQAVSALLHKNLDLENETLRVVRIQTKAGAGVQLDVLRAEAQVQTTQAQLPTVDAQIQLDCNRIAVLLGETPGTRDAALKPAQTIPAFASVPGLDAPADIIADRPDVQNAEFLFEQEAVLKGIRSTDMFPKVSLSGFFGLSTSSYFGSSTPLNLAGQIARPLLDYGRIQNQIAAQDARKQQAFLTYKQTVLLAVEDVERSLVLFGQEQQRLKTLQTTADIQSDAAHQARLKYQAGDATFLDVLYAEQQLLDAQLSEAQSRARLATNGVDLYTALGASVVKTPGVLARN